MATYVASARPAFRSGSIVHSAIKEHSWRTSAPAGDVAVRRGPKRPALPLAERRKRASVRY